MKRCAYLCVFLLAAASCSDDDSPTDDTGPGSDFQSNNDGGPGSDGTQNDSSLPPASYWAGQIGGDGTAYGRGLAVDGQGNTLVTGKYTGTISVGASNHTALGQDDVFVAKFSSDGQPVWSNSVGGADLDFPGWNMAVDSQGNGYVIGKFGGQATFGTQNLAATGSDCFVAKFSAADGSVLWAVNLGGSGDDYGWAVAVGSDDAPYVTGEFEGQVTMGSTNLSSNGEEDVFVAKLNASTGAVEWAVNGGGAEGDGGSTIVLDPQNNIYLGGSFRGSATFGATTLTSSGERDMFAAQLSSANGAFNWAVSFGGTADDHADDFALSGQGIPYFMGTFSSQITIGGSTFSTADEFHSDAVVAKLDAASGAAQWAIQITAGEWGATNGIGVDPSGNLVVAGEFDAPMTVGAMTLTNVGGNDIFVAKYSGTDGSPLWGTSTGSASTDMAWAMTLDARGDVYATGGFSETVAFGAQSLTSQAGVDAYVWKLKTE